MSSTQFVKAALLTLIIVTAFVAVWESYWRNRGFAVSYNDDEALWAKERSRAYKSRDEATVFIGSSRIKFNLDIPTWEKLTGDEVIQLSLVGTSPRPLLHDLGNDENFRGKLIVDVTERLFFDRNTVARNRSAVKAITYYKEETPSQKMSSLLNHGLEGKFVFLEEGKFGLDELLKDLEIPDRPGIFTRPRFPKDFGLTTYRRQTYMSKKFLADTNLQKRQCQNWIKTGGLSKQPGISGDSLEAVFKEIKASVDKIRARGGEVIFIRTPVSGPMKEAERVAYPREQYWEKLLAYTKSAGIHYEDDPVTANMICPEWSHLSSDDAVLYTKALVHALQLKGWNFKRNETVKPNQL